jgi:hypothetical protein
MAQLYFYRFEMQDETDLLHQYEAIASSVKLVLQGMVKLTTNNFTKNAIVDRLDQVIKGKLYIDQFIEAVTTYQTLVRDNLILRSYGESLFDNDEENACISDTELRMALEELGGNPRSLEARVPEKLSRLVRANDLVVCHGRANDKIEMSGFDAEGAWYLDADPMAKPDIQLCFQKLPLHLVPKFTCVMFVYGPVTILQQFFEFADKILVPTGKIVIPSRGETAARYIEQAVSCGWKLVEVTNMSIGDRPTRAWVFQRQSS